MENGHHNNTTNNNNDGIRNQFHRRSIGESIRGLNNDNINQQQRARTRFMSSSSSSGSRSQRKGLNNSGGFTSTCQAATAAGIVPPLLDLAADCVVSQIEFCSQCSNTDNNNSHCNMNGWGAIQSSFAAAMGAGSESSTRKDGTQLARDDVVMGDNTNGIEEEEEEEELQGVAGRRGRSGEGGEREGGSSSVGAQCTCPGGAMGFIVGALRVMDGSTSTPCPYHQGRLLNSDNGRSSGNNNNDTLDRAPSPPPPPPSAPGDSFLSSQTEQSSHTHSNYSYSNLQQQATTSEQQYSGQTGQAVVFDPLEADNSVLAEAARRMSCGGAGGDVLNSGAVGNADELKRFNQMQRGSLVGNGVFHEDVSHIILKRLSESGCVNDKTLQLFFNPETSRITKLDLSGCSEVTDETMKRISNQPLTEIDFNYCESLNGLSLNYLAQCAPTLRKLNLEGCILHYRANGSVAGPSGKNISSTSSTHHKEENIKTEFVGFVLVQGVENGDKAKGCSDGAKPVESYTVPKLSALYNLEDLNLQGTGIPGFHTGYGYIEEVAQLRNLKVLDLSGNLICDNDLEKLCVLKDTLIVLKLRKTSITDTSGLSLRKFSNLRELDISDNTNLSSDYFFHSISCLSNLAHLEMAYTRLHNTGFVVLKEELNQLQFLSINGTYVTEEVNKPGLTVAGDNSVEEVLNSLRSYSFKTEYVFNSLKLLFAFYKRELPATDNGVISLLLDIMQRHISQVGIQIAGSASIYHLTKPTIAEQTPEARKRAIDVILDCMNENLENYQLQKNCCLTLCNFDIPAELEPFCEKLVVQLLETALAHYDDLIQRICIGLSNSLVCSGTEEKARIGAAGGIKNIMELIKLKCNNYEIDIVMETAWSALWNITDETSSNCKIFLDENGIDLFMTVATNYPGQHGLIRNMLGLLGNIAEVQELREKLMKPDLLTALKGMLANCNEGIEISYNASGIISNLLTEDSFWSDNNADISLSIDREELQQAMSDAILGWDLRSVRSINYRSLVPILALAKPKLPYSVKLWATWAMCNLCIMYPSKYCPLVKEEGGCGHLAELVNDEYEPLANLARTCLERVDRYRSDSETHSLAGDVETGDSMQIDG
eukprot:Nk52_evm4s2506 gene=Nk52_evmTU4s2506